MDDRLTQYIEEHIDMEPEELHRLDRLTNIRLHNGRMCSGHLQGRILKTLTAMAAPGRVLELGTFSGYSVSLHRRRTRRTGPRRHRGGGRRTGGFYTRSHRILSAWREE